MGISHIGCDHTCVSNVRFVLLVTLLVINHIACDHTCVSINGLRLLVNLLFTSPECFACWDPILFKALSKLSGAAFATQWHQRHGWPPAQNISACLLFLVKSWWCCICVCSPAQAIACRNAHRLERTTVLYKILYNYNGKSLVNGIYAYLSVALTALGPFCNQTILPEFLNAPGSLQVLSWRLSEKCLPALCKTRISLR